MSFFDHHRYPRWELTDDRVDWFLRFQEKGRKVLTPEQLLQIEPLIWCQKCKEITLQQLVDEMSEWWSKGWGWIYPLQSTLETTHERLMKLALLRIHRRIRNEGFLSFFLRYPGLKQFEKDRRIREMQSSTKHLKVS